MLRPRNPITSARSLSRIAAAQSLELSAKIPARFIGGRHSSSSTVRCRAPKLSHDGGILFRSDGTNPWIGNNRYTISALPPSTPLANLILRRYLSTTPSDEEPKTTAPKNSSPTPTTKEVATTLPSHRQPSTDHYSISAAYGWLLKGLKKDKSLSSMAAATGFMAGEGLMANQPAVLLGRIVDEVGSTLLVGSEGGGGSALASPIASDAMMDLSTNATILPLFYLIGASIICKEVCTIGRKYLVERSATSLQKTAFLEQARHLLAVRVDALQNQRVGSLVVKLDKSVEGLIKLQKQTFLEGAPNVAAASVALVYACSEHPVVGATMVGVVCLGSAITSAQIRSQKGIRIDLNEKKAFMGAGVVDLLNNLGYIRASGMRPLEERRLDDMAEQVRSTEFLHHKYMMSFSGARDIVEQAGFVLVVGGAVHLALSGEITSGAILTLAMLYSKATQPLQKMHKVLDEGHEAVIKIGIMGPLRALPADPGLNGTKQPQLGFAQPLVAKDLTLTRIGGGKPVLQKLSISLNRGEIIGIAGTSGSGKSTLLKCALGLIPDYSGSLALLGAEARDADKMALSQALVYAQQEPFVLTGTIKENLLASCSNGQVEGGDDALHLALQRACLGPSDFTGWDQNGLNTEIHEAGRNLSGGQRQRLALARVFLLMMGDAQLVILDEATSALDNVTEARVIDELQRQAKEQGATVVMVAHRLSTLRRADRVLMMDQGGIAQDGSFGELEVSDGPFRDLLEARARAVPVVSSVQ